MLEIKGLSKSFGDFSVLKNLNANINKGDCVAIIGPSGTGKSVFLRCIAMLENPTEGSVIVGGQDITKKGVNLNLVRQKMGMVYQDFNLFAHLSVKDNITLAPMHALGLSKKEAEEKANELLALVGLSDKASAFPATLSGGQQQRVAIARCLAMNPDIILFDEPTSALDPTMVGEVLAIIRKLVKTGLTMIIVTHEMAFAEEFSNRVFYMDEHGIYEEGSPEQIFHNPQKPKTIAFIKKLKVFEEYIVSKGFDIVAMNAKIEQFCIKYGMEKKAINSIELIIEEIIMLLFRDFFLGEPDLSIKIEYSEKDGKVIITAEYAGKEFCPWSLSDTDDLGIIMINKLGKEVAFSYENGKNILKIFLY